MPREATSDSFTPDDVYCRTPEQHLEGRSRDGDSTRRKHQATDRVTAFDKGTGFTVNAHINSISSGYTVPSPTYSPTSPTSPMPTYGPTSPTYPMAPRAEVGQVPGTRKRKNVDITTPDTVKKLKAEIEDIDHTMNAAVDSLKESIKKTQARAKGKKLGKRAELVDAVKKLWAEEFVEVILGPVMEHHEDKDYPVV